MPRVWVAVVAGLTALAVVFGVGQAGATSIDRCASARQLLAASRDADAVEQLKKALDKDATRQCATDQLVAIPKASTPPEPAPAQCKVADDLVSKGLLDEAKEQYKKALEEEKGDKTCAVDGLKTIEDDTDHTSPKEAVDAIWDWAARAWPWAAGLLLLGGFLYLYGGLCQPKRIAVQASKSDADFAKAVIAAANAAGGDAAARPSKLVLGEEDKLPDDTLADLSKLLQFPAAAPLNALVKLVTLPRTSRLRVSWSSAGGWAVAELALSRPCRSRANVRIAIRPGAADEKKQQETLALAAGAWLVALLSSGDQAPASKNDDVLLANALFRAGANVQLRGAPEDGLACYAEMPAVQLLDAPFAWVGARLNTMFALQLEDRNAEAAAMGYAADAAADELLAPGSLGPEYFGEPDLRELQLRSRYMLAVFLVNLVVAGDDEPHPNAASTAVSRLAAALDEEARNRRTDLEHGFFVAARLVVLCFEALTAVPTGRAIKEVLYGSLSAAADQRALPPLTAAAYYDAACAYSLRALRAKQTQADADVKATFELLRLAVRAVPASSLPRLQEQAQSDAMLAYVRELPPLGEPPMDFNTALGIVVPATPTARIAVDLTETK